MAYQLILSEPVVGKDKDVGENVFFDNLPSDYAVYMFYYPGATPNEDMESKLRDLGNMAGKNLFVNIGRLNDPHYGKMAKIFNIKNLPVVIVTAIDKLASSSTEFLTTYVRIDDRRLTESPDSVIPCLERIYNLFVQGKIAEAIRQAKNDKRNTILSRLKKLVSNTLKGIWEFVSDVDISVSLIEGKFELKHK